MFFIIKFDKETIELSAADKKCIRYVVSRTLGIIHKLQTLYHQIQLQRKCALTVKYNKNSER